MTSKTHRPLRNARTVRLARRPRFGSICHFEWVVLAFPALSSGTPKASGGAGKDAGHDYDVGYRRPPVAARFQPGRTGNPKGRPKKKNQPPNNTKCGF
jgi:hypothetical protein